MDENRVYENTSEEFTKLAAAGRKAALYVNTIEEFADWITVNNRTNLVSIDVIECHSILEEFVKSNEHIIERINKLRSFK